MKDEIIKYIIRALFASLSLANVKLFIAGGLAKLEDAVEKSETSIDDAAFDIIKPIIVKLFGLDEGGETVAEIETDDSDA